MKRKFILLPITLTTLAPAISLVGCGDPDPVKPTETYVVTLFAGEGTFGESNQIILSNIKPGTILRDVEGYKTPEGESFIGWLNNGQMFQSDQPVNANMLLTAKYNDPQAKHTITLFAGDGLFSDGTNVKKVSVTGDKTTLEQAIGDIEPTGATKFHGWVTSTGGQPTMTDPVITDIELSAAYEPAIIKHKAYVITTDDKEITLTNKDVEDKKQFNTTVIYSAGDIAPANISVYVNGQLVTATIAQGADSHHVNVELAATVTTGDVTIITKFVTELHYSYLCNDPEDGLTITNNEIQPGATTIGTINSTDNINGNWQLHRVIIGGNDVTNNFELVIDASNPKKATINVLNGFVVNGDPLIWLDPIVGHVDWDINQGPFQYEIPSASVPPEEALNQYYDFLVNDKTNIVKDFCNATIDLGAEGQMSISCDITKIVVDSDESKTIIVDWNFDYRFIYGTSNQRLNLKAKGIKFVCFPEEEFGYIMRSALPYGSLDYNEIRLFLLDESSPWSIEGYETNWDETIVFDYDINDVKDDALWENEKDEIISVYEKASIGAGLPIHYLKNITPPEN